jgi:formate dehydrogenase major subunit
MGEYRSLRQERQYIKTHETLAHYIATEMTPTGYWANFPKFIISLRKSRYGEAATRDNQYGYDWLPKNVGNHSHMPMFIAMAEGEIK